MTTLRRWASDGRWLWAITGGFSLWHLAHLSHHSWLLSTPISAVFSVFGPTAAALGIGATGVWLGCRWETDSLRRVGRWAVVGAAAAAVLSVLAILYFGANGVVLPDWLHFTSNVVTGGAAAGTLVGVYDARAVRIAGRLRREHRRVDQLNQRLRVLNRVLRHDVRNDVNVIHGYASLLADSGDEEVAARAEIIREKADELSALGERARDLERLLDDERDDARTDLAAIVSRRLDGFDRTYPHARLRAELPERAPVGPVPLLDVVVDLLVENAVVHNDADEPLVSVRVRTSEDCVRLRVADDGPGIPEAERAVFESGTETPLHHSDGLGLWVVEWIVSEADGTLSFGDRDRGTAISVTLPRAGSRTATDPEPRARTAPVSERLAASLQSIRGGPE